MKSWRFFHLENEVYLLKMAFASENLEKFPLRRVLLGMAILGGFCRLYGQTANFFPGGHPFSGPTAREIPDEFLSPIHFFARFFEIRAVVPKTGGRPQRTGDAYTLLLPKSKIRKKD